MIKMVTLVMYPEEVPRDRADGPGAARQNIDMLVSDHRKMFQQFDVPVDERKHDNQWNDPIDKKQITDAEHDAGCGQRGEVAEHTEAGCQFGGGTGQSLQHQIGDESWRPDSKQRGQEKLEGEPPAGHRLIQAMRQVGLQVWIDERITERPVVLAEMTAAISTMALQDKISSRDRAQQDAQAPVPGENAV
ncbi:MAG TPA: hypothetical protein VFC19_06765 [Candidatus Limnocylindrales bacterium]|nr:hypothetical protein [Candidatus Limnocylindrales bacterium]